MSAGSGRRRWLAGAAALTLLCACAHAPPAPVLEAFPAPGEPVSAYGFPLGTGQVVVSRSGGALSVFFSLYPQTYSPYVHAGVVVLEGGRPFVYHTMGMMIPVYNRPPSSFTFGHVLRTPFDDFVAEQGNVEVFAPPPSVDRERVAEFARDRYAEGTPFDPYFDASDRTALYCTEFVAAALEAGGGGPYPVTPNRDNRSLAVVRRWLGITAGGSIQAATLVAGDRHVGTLSARDSLARARARAAVIHEIHRRFTADQRLGNVFEWTGTRLVFRPAVRTFYLKALHLYDDASVPPTPEAAEQAVRALARELFGPVAPGPALRAAR